MPQLLSPLTSSAHVPAPGEERLPNEMHLFPPGVEELSVGSIDLLLPLSTVQTRFDKETQRLSEWLCSFQRVSGGSLPRSESSIQQFELS